MPRPFLVDAALVAGVATVIAQLRSNRQKEVISMGVVKTALNEINAQLNKVHAEFTGKLDELLARETLSDEDRAAIEELRGTAQKLDDVVPDAVVEPLPDPETPPEAGGDEPVVDPEDPVDPVEVTEPEAPVEDAPVEDVPAEDAPVADEPAPADPGTVGDVAPDTATEDGTDEGTAPTA